MNLSHTWSGRKEKKRLGNIQVISSVVNLKGHPCWGQAISISDEPSFNIIAHVNPAPVKCAIKTINVIDSIWIENVYIYNSTYMDSFNFWAKILIYLCDGKRGCAGGFKQVCLSLFLYFHAVFGEKKLGEILDLLLDLMGCLTYHWLLLGPCYTEQFVPAPLLSMSP